MMTIRFFRWIGTFDENWNSRDNIQGLPDTGWDPYARSALVMAVRARPL